MSEESTEQQTSTGTEDENGASGGQQGDAHQKAQ
jgi:hypothetical protein